MDKTLNEGVRHAHCDNIPVIVIRVMRDIQHGLFYLTDTVAEEIDRYHRYGIAFGIVCPDDIVLVGILCPEILAETQSLCVKPCLLQLYEDKLLLATLVDDGRGEVYAEHRDIVTVGVGILMRTNLHTHHLTLQECGDKGARYPLVLNKIFEDGIIYGVRDVYSHG